MAIEKGLRKIDYDLDVVNFIRFQLQTRSLLKQLFTTEQRKTAKDLKSHFDSDPSDASDESDNIDPDPFETEEPREEKSANVVKPTTNPSADQIDSSQIEQIERPQLELIDFYQDRRAGTQIRKQQQKKK